MTRALSRPSSLAALLLAAASAMHATEAPPAAAPPPDAAAVVATVNGEPVYLEDLEERLAELHGEVSETTRAAFDLDALMDRLVNDTLLAQEARALELDAEPPIPGRLEDRRLELAVERLQREEVWSRDDATDDEVRELFAERFRRVTLRVLTTYEEEEATATLAELEAGADFATLARERSKDPYGPRGGLVEALPRYDLQRDIAAAAFGLAPGQLFGPVLTDIGWAVLQVEQFLPPEEERFEPARRELAQTIRFQKSQALKEALAARLRERHAVTVDQEVLAAIRRERLPDGRLVPRPADPTAAVATVGGRAITAETYARALMLRWAGVRNEAAAEAAAPIVLERMIGDELLAAEALARGYGATPEVERLLHAYENRLLVRRYLEEVVGAGLAVSEEEMRAWYDDHVDQLRKPPRIHLAQITVATAEDQARIAELARDGADFAWLARQHSLDNLKAGGGDAGWSTPRPGLDELNDTLLAAQPGEVLEPRGGDQRFLVLKVIGRQEQGTYPFSEVSGNARKAVFQEKATRAIAELMGKLRERSQIEIHRDVLAKLSISGSQQEEAESGSGMPQAHGNHAN